MSEINQGREKDVEQLKVNLEWLKDEEKMKNLSDKEREELANMYVDKMLSFKYPCLRCGSIKLGSEMYSLQENGEGYFCSKICNDGKYNLKKRLKKIRKRKKK